jgi:hypothetical protein
VSVELDIQFVDLWNTEQEKAFRRKMGGVVGDESGDGPEGAGAVGDVDEAFFVIFRLPSTC